MKKHNINQTECTATISNSATSSTEQEPPQAKGMEWWVGRKIQKCNQAHVCDNVLAHWMNCNLRRCHT